MDEAEERTRMQPAYKYLLILFPFSLGPCMWVWICLVSRVGRTAEVPLPSVQ